MNGDWPDSVADMARVFTPQEAASIKARALAWHLAAEPDPRIDALVANDGGHRWFCYCLDAVARA